MQVSSGVEIDSSYVKLAAYSMDYQTLANIVLPLSDTDPARGIDKIVDGCRRFKLPQFIASTPRSGDRLPWHDQS